MTDKLNKKLDEILMWSKLQCPKCGFVFTDKSNFRSHLIMEGVER